MNASSSRALGSIRSRAVFTVSNAGRSCSYQFVVSSSQSLSSRARRAATLRRRNAGTIRDATHKDGRGWQSVRGAPEERSRRDVEVAVHELGPEGLRRNPIALERLRFARFDALPQQPLVLERQRPREVVGKRAPFAFAGRFERERHAGFSPRGRGR